MLSPQPHTLKQPSIRQCVQHGCILHGNPLPVPPVLARSTAPSPRPMRCLPRPPVEDEDTQHRGPPWLQLSGGPQGRKPGQGFWEEGQVPCTLQLEQEPRASTSRNSPKGILRQRSLFLSRRLSWAPDVTRDPGKPAGCGGQNTQAPAPAFSSAPESSGGRGVYCPGAAPGSAQPRSCCRQGKGEAHPQQREMPAPDCVLTSSALKKKKKISPCPKHRKNVLLNVMSSA